MLYALLCRALKSFELEAEQAISRSIDWYISSRIFREKQYAERRLKDFDDALSKEAVRAATVKAIDSVSAGDSYRITRNVGALC